MPLVRRKITIREAIYEVSIAPLVFILVGFVSGLPWLVLITILSGMIALLSPVRLAGFVPGHEVIFEAVTAFVAVYICIAVAAVPLVIRDYFSNGGFKIVWKPSVEVLAITREYAELLLLGETAAFYDFFAESLKSELPYEQFVKMINQNQSKLGPFSEIDSVIELRIAAGNPNDINEETLGIALTQVHFVHSTSAKASMSLDLNTQASNQIIMFDLSGIAKE